MKRYLSFILLLALMLGIFSVSHAQVTTYPFVEGFEQGQTHGAQVQGWTQILGEYNNYWIANSRTISFNRTPRNGSFNATIRWESDAWIMREFTLQGGQSYDVEVWARQNTDVAADASIGLYYGTAATIADMTNTIVAQTGVIDGDYQRVWGSFTPDADGIYWIGIHGVVTTSPMYMSIDDFVVKHTPTGPVFTIIPTGYDFGSLKINTTGSKTFTMMNVGIGTLNISGISPTTDGFFTVTDAPGFPVTLAANETATFTIQYAPTEAGNHTGTFTFTDDTRAPTNFTVSGSCYDPTIYTFPWIEDFTDTTFPPEEWGRYEGLYPTDSLTPSTSRWYRAANFAGEEGNPSARINIYGNFTRHWLVTPPIAIPATGYQLDFDIALTTRNEGNPVYPYLQQDDRFIVLISDDPAMVGAQILREWNNTGSEHMYNDIATQGEFQVIDLSAHVGTKYIGFYAESTESGGDVHLYLDSVRVRETPSTPIFSLEPTEWDFGRQVINTTSSKTFTIMNAGGGTLNVTGLSPVSNGFFTVLNAPNWPVPLTTGQTASFTIQYAPTAAGNHTATFTISYDGGTADVTVSGECHDPIIYTYPFTEGFEAGQTDTTPVGGAWTQYRDDDKNRDWIANSSQTDHNRAPRNGSFNAYLTYRGNAWLMRPFSLQAEQPYYVEVWARQDGATPSDASVGLYYGSTGTVAGMTETIKVQTGVIDGDYQCVAGTFTPSATGIYWIGIHGIIGVIRYLSIDDIRVQLASTEVLPPILVSPEDGATGLPKAGFDLTWQADSAGAAPASYAVYLASDPANIYDEHRWETTNISFNPVLEDDTFSFAYGQRYYWTVGAIFGGDEVVNEPPHFFDIEADPTVTTLPWTENFDSVPVDEMPVGWKIIASHTGADGRPWGVAEYSEVGAHSGTKCAIVIWHALYPKDEWMITPPISMQAGQSYNISFAVKGTGLDGVPESLALRWGTEPTVAAMTANPAVFDNNGAAYADWTMVNAMFTPPATGIYFFGWHAYTQASVFYIAVDTITISQCFDVDLAIVGTSGQTIGNVGEPVVRTVAVRNMGTTAQSNYTVYLKEAVTNNVLAQELITEIIDAGETVVHTLSWTPAAAGVVNLYAEVALAGDQELANNVTDPVEVTIYPANMELLFVGNPASNQGVHLFPFTAAYGDLVAETVYLASEMQATDGVIHQVAYYSYFAHDMTLSHNVQIWMKNTDTVNLEAGWLPWDGYQLVYDGPVEFTTGTHEIIIPLTTPFNYTGGNLAIRTSKTYDAAADPNIYNLWLLDTRGHYGYRTRYETSDAGELDHTNPTGTNVTYVYPNITFFMSTTNLVETVDAPVVTMTIAEPNALLDWELIPYAYGYNVYLAADPYNFGSIPAGTVYGAGAQINNITDAEKLFVKVTGVTYRDFNRAQALLRNLEPREIRLVDENLIGKAKQDLQVLTP